MAFCGIGQRATPPWKPNTEFPQAPLHQWHSLIRYWTRQSTAEFKTTNGGKQIALELGRQFADADTESAVALWSKSCGDVDRQVLELLIRSRSKATIILATNATSRLSCDLQALGIDEHFDFIANSSDMGQIKPEAEYYRRALDIAGVRAERAVFIDDTIENVEQASIQGLHGHHYTGIEELKTFLSAHGLS